MSQAESSERSSASNPVADQLIEVGQQLFRLGSPQNGADEVIFPFGDTALVVDSAGHAYYVLGEGPENRFGVAPDVNGLAVVAGVLHYCEAGE